MFTKKFYLTCYFENRTLSNSTNFNPLLYAIVPTYYTCEMTVTLLFNKCTKLCSQKGKRQTIWYYLNLHIMYLVIVIYWNRTSFQHIFKNMMKLLKYYNIEYIGT